MSFCQNTKMREAETNFTAEGKLHLKLGKHFQSNHFSLLGKAFLKLNIYKSESRESIPCLKGHNKFLSKGHL